MRRNWTDQPLLEVKPLDSTTAKDLQGLNLPPVEFIVENFLPFGLVLLGAPPKSFKSYMCLDMCLCVCRGFDFMGFKTQKQACLYMDLESTLRRPKSRIEQILQGAEAPDNLHFVTDAKPIGKGFEQQLAQMIEAHPEIKVVVVDVFKKIRPPKKAGIDPYERDYEDYGVIKALADRLGLAIILVTHTTKMKHPDDPFNELSGSAGTMGSVDVAMVIKKEKRNDNTAKLYITGRDLEEQCYEMKFNKQAFRWEKLGAVSDLEKKRIEDEYITSPVIKTVIRLIDQNGGKWSGSAKDIISASKYFQGCKVDCDDKRVGKELAKFSEQLAKWDFIEFHYDKNARPRKYVFIKKQEF